jgi:energy-coupling factor transporter ATP-binding protein EcfA2
LLPVEFVDESGLVITSDGALVRIVQVFPPNPLVLAPEDRQRLADGFCHLVGRLRPSQSVQFYAQAKPIDVEDLLDASRHEVARWAGPPPVRGGGPLDRRALDRWRLYGAMEESIRLHADDQAAVEFGAYVVIPFVPVDPSSARSVIADLLKPAAKLEKAPLQRDMKAHGRVLRKAYAHVDAIRAELDAMAIPHRLLDGSEVADLLFSRFNPSAADRGARPAYGAILGGAEPIATPEDARARAERCRTGIACSALDFTVDSEYVLVDRDAEQVIYAASTAESTYFGWLMLTMLSCREPYALSVHIQALDRRAERSKVKRRYRRTFVLNREAEMRGQLPDFDRYFAEQEHRQILADMSGHERAGLFKVSIYQAIRVAGPEPDTGRLREAIEHASEQISSACDCSVDRGRFQQLELWQSTLPLGRDVARRARRYGTVNVGDSTPLLGVAVGSPDGVPFAYTDPGRTLEKFNPYDRVHPNHLCLVTGRSGAGKTMLCNVLLARLIAHGARAFVIDRAGHYRVLTQMLDGAQHLDIGSDDSEFSLNPWDVADPAAVGREKVAFLIALHETMIEEGLTTLERAQLGSAIRAVYERAAREGVTPRESLLKQELEQRARLELDAGATDIAFALRNLAERLGEFCEPGAYAHVADEPSSHFPDTPLLVFDTRRCPDVLLKPVIFTVLEFITRAVEAHRDANRALAAAPDAPLFAGRSVMLGDEFWSVVANPALGSYANDLARRSRHLGLTMLVSTQQLSDLDNDSGLALLRNSSIQIFLHQHREELAFVRRALGLTESEIDLISRLKTVKGAYSQAYWINGTRGRGQVSVRVGPTELWAFTSDPVRDVPLRELKIAEHGDDVWRAIAELAGARAAEPPARTERLAVEVDGDG